MAANEKNPLNVNGIKQLKENNDTKRITFPMPMVKERGVPRILHKLQRTLTYRMGEYQTLQITQHLKLKTKTRD